MSNINFRNKDNAFINYRYEKTNKSLRERLDACSSIADKDAGFLYICKEYERCKTIKKDIPVSDNYAKVGVNCSSKGPWERLRVLQQGNPRDLKFVQLYVGRADHIKLLEQIILSATIYERGCSEWIYSDPDSLKNLADEIIEHFGLYVWLLDHTPKYLPYSACNKSSSWLSRPSKELQTQIIHIQEQLLIEENLVTPTEIEE